MKTRDESQKNRCRCTDREIKGGSQMEGGRGGEMEEEEHLFVR